MITRRNWLLRCSILINVVVLLYICSHVIYGDSSLQLASSSSSAYLIQTGIAGASNNVAGAGNARDEGANNNNYLISRTSNNKAESVKVIPEDNNNNINNINNNAPNGDNVQLLQIIPKMEQHLQQQQKQEQMLEEQQLKEMNDNNVDDSRFEVPTETIGQGVAGVGNNPGGDNTNAAGQNVIYPDATNLSSTNGTIYADGFGATNIIESRIKSIIQCLDREYNPETLQRGDFWVLKNYIRADHGLLRCFESITYTTHGDYTFLDNLIPLVERWMAPISIALHAPGTDFLPTINSIKYLRECAPEAHLVRQYVTFHVYFSSKHIPKNVQRHDKVLESQFNCSMTPPFVNASYTQLYKTQKKLLYPVNVGRNVARDAAMTYFILASDIELYPSPGLVHKFLNMISRNEGSLKNTKPRVFPLPIFEVDKSIPVPPRDKTELQDLFSKGKAILFHKMLCPSCHGVPKSKEWMAANETDGLNVFHIGKRIGSHLHWEPIYIGTHADPHYDERLSWEGKSDKMTQGYALCALDYEFHILDNAFLVHKPGIKVLKKDSKRAMFAAKTNQLIKKIIYPELAVMYGIRKGCAI